ncbi:hypothetical protein D3C75_405870 [compost metagenome]
MSPLTVEIIRVCASTAALSVFAPVLVSAEGVGFPLLDAFEFVVPVEQALNTMVKHNNRVSSNDGLAFLNIGNSPSPLY